MCYSAYLRERLAEIKKLEQGVKYKNELYLHYLCKKHFPLSWGDGDLQVRNTGDILPLVACFSCLAEHAGPSSLLTWSFFSVVFAVNNLEGWDNVSFWDKEHACLLLAVKQQGPNRSVPWLLGKATASAALIGALASPLWDMGAKDERVWTCWYCK